jgi:hypothetical protein
MPNTGYYWTEAEKKQALKIYQQKIKNGLNKVDALQATAVQTGKSFSAIGGVVYRNGAARISEVTESPYAVYNESLVVHGDFLALGDTQAPFHNFALINKAVKAAKNAGIDTLILGGDAIENDMLSTYDNGFSDGEKVTGISKKAAKDLMARRKKR